MADLNSSDKLAAAKEAYYQAGIEYGYIERNVNGDYGSYTRIKKYPRGSDEYNAA